MELSGKIYSLQMVRALAAWVVVLHHIGFDFYGHDVASNGFWVFFANYGSVGVDIFFVLSGFVIALIANSYTGRPGIFMIKRIDRVMPNYWFYTLLMTVSLLVLPVGTYFTTVFSAENALLSFLLIPHANLSGYGNFPLLTAGWTLSFEMFFYFLFTLSLALVGAAARYLCFALLIAMALLVHFTPLPNFLGNNIFLLFEFALGMAIYQYLIVLGGQSYRLINRIIALSTLVAALVFWWYFGYSGYTKMALAGPVLFLALVFNDYVDANARVAKWLILLGDISFSTYLANLVVIGWVSCAFSALAITPSANTFGVVTIVLVFLLSYLSWRYLECVHFYRWFINTRAKPA